MANYDFPADPTYSTEIRKLEDTDPASATNTFNPLIQQLINNTQAVKSTAEGAAANAQTAKTAAEKANTAAESANNAAATISNPNLLDNWYFLDPINQRGQEEYSVIGKRSYTIDRWYIEGRGSMTISGDTGITLKKSIGSSDIFFNFLQILDNAATYAGKQVTFSALINGAATISVGYNNNYPTNTTDTAREMRVLQVTYTFPKEVDIKKADVVIQARSNDNYNIIAAKLELGDRQTLAHQDSNGNWVLNDPPPNKALELAKCQRYQIVLTNNPNEHNIVGTFSAYDDGNDVIIVPLPATMRNANPTVNIVGSLSRVLIQPENKWALISSPAVNISMLSNNLLKLVLSYEASNTRDIGWYQLETADSKIIIDNNL